MTSIDRTNREIEISNRRAKSLAFRPDTGENKSSQTEMVEARLGYERYGVRLDLVREIQNISRTEICRIPNAPAHVLGLANYRGQALPLLKLSSFLSAQSNLQYDELAVVIISREGSDIGLCFDTIVGVVTVDMADVDELQTGDNFHWITKDRVGLLNLEHLLSERTLG